MQRGIALKNSMIAKTLVALKSSIEKWILNCQATKWYEVTTATHECPLCDLFILDDCTGCPVFKATNKPLCQGTPYRKIIRVRKRSQYLHPMRSVETLSISKHAKRLIKAEAEFLESLMPK